MERVLIKLASYLNKSCPCGSKNKYKKCCGIFHKGSEPKTALELMKSRYSAFALNNPKYIIKTTHKENIDYNSNSKLWEKSILDFSKNTIFEKLIIINFEEKTDTEAYVTFKAILSQNGVDVSFIEKSKFLKVDNSWKYHSGDIKND